MLLKVSVKWQKELFEGLEINTEYPPLVFKGQLFELTGVPPDRQKIMVKGGLLQDDSDWNKVGIKNGQRLMMMGTAEQAPVAPAVPPTFVEDLPEEDQEGALMKLSSAGLVNLGNTCYMNSTLQCLHSVPSLSSALSQYTQSAGIDQDMNHRLTLAARDLFKELDHSMRPVPPIRLLLLLRDKFPQFAQQGEGGVYMQQDAEECWTQFLSVLSLRLRSPNDVSQAAVKEIFGIDITSRITCAESGEESSESETAFALKCHITGEVNQLEEGLEKAMTVDLEKVSQSLGVSAIFKKQSQISRLPPYLTVQFVRFFWKRESKQKAKILRKVTFPIQLDVFPFCSEELQKNLEGPRKALKISDQKKKEEEAGAAAAATAASASKQDPAQSSSSAATLSNGEPAQDAAGKENNRDTNMTDGGTAYTAPAADAEPAKSASSLLAGPLTGLYELMAVLTHKGRSADSGHYVAWVKQQNGQWIEFDDEKPILRREEDITNLSGGGDWHMAYILLYRARTLQY